MKIFFGNISVAGQQGAVGQVSETDLAQAIDKRKFKTLGQVTETDLAQAIDKRKFKTLGQVTETDLAQIIKRVVSITVNQVTETDIAFAITTTKRKAIVQITEIDLVQPIGKLKSKSIEQVTESDIAQSISKAKRLVLGQVFENEIAQPISVLKTKAIEQVSETDLSQSINVQKQRVAGQTIETDLAQIISSESINYVDVERVIETDNATLILVKKYLGIGIAEEFNFSLALDAVLKKYQINRAEEFDSAFQIGKRKRINVGQVAETDLAQNIFLPGGGGPKLIPLNMVLETDRAFTIRNYYIEDENIVVKGYIREYLTESFISYEKVFIEDEPSPVRGIILED